MTDTQFAWSPVTEQLGKRGGLVGGSFGEGSISCFEIIDRSLDAATHEGLVVVPVGSMAEASADLGS